LKNEFSVGMVYIFIFVSLVKILFNKQIYFS